MTIANTVKLCNAMMQYRSWYSTRSPTDILYEVCQGQRLSEDLFVEKATTKMASEISAASSRYKKVDFKSVGRVCNLLLQYSKRFPEDDIGGVMRTIFEYHQWKGFPPHIDTFRMYFLYFYQERTRRDSGVTKSSPTPTSVGEQK